jgi:2-dehydro-3-deoxyphosphooctonate aldolase (KDO 8-P synthase)
VNGLSLQKVAEVRVSDGVVLGRDDLVLIAGPCVIESEQHALGLATRIAEIAGRHSVPYIFKASFDKANRTSRASYRGPGLAEGLAILGRIGRSAGVAVLTDIHETSQAEPAAAVADVLQIPAFLSRQTDLIAAAAATGRAVNIKKGQFLAPLDMQHALAKASAAAGRVFLTERGTSFGYHDLVVDMRSFPMMRRLGHPVVFDVTHSLQLPGAGDGASGGLSDLIEPLAAAGVAAGIDGLFLEVHDDPSKAMSDGPNALPIQRLEPLLERLVRINALVKSGTSSPS